MGYSCHNRSITLLFGVLLFGCTTPHHLVKFDTPIRNQDVKPASIKVNSFNIVTTKRDKPQQKQQFMEDFIQYLQYNRSVIELQKRYPDLVFDITIKPKRNIKRTWILDAPFFFPYVGFWPFTPWWGTTSVLIDIQAVIPNKDFAKFSFNQDNNFSISVYPYYRAGRFFTNDYRMLYANLFTDISNFDFEKNWTGSHNMLEYSNAERTVASISPASDVDCDIPETHRTSDKTFVLIIGNENYSNEIAVPYARNDAWAFRQYAQKALGIPGQNIYSIDNATYGQMLTSLDWLTNVIKAYQGEASVIFYYAGHGMPDQATTSAYLLPTDGSSINLTAALKLEYLYDKLAAYPTEGVTIFLDACFTGDSRTAMLTTGRGVKLRPRQEAVPGNLVVLTATSAEETALPYTEKQHGLFTYYFLKKLKESPGDINLKELSNYLIKNVTRQSALVNNKPQTPQVIFNSSMTEKWEERALK